MKKSASIIKTKTNFWIFCQSKTTACVWVAMSPFMKMSLLATSDEFITNLFTALDASGDIVPHPLDLKAFKNDFHKNLEMKSVKTFYTGAKRCEVFQVGNTINLLPTKNVNNKGWFDHLSDLGLEISRSESKENIYSIVKDAFSKSI